MFSEAAKAAQELAGMRAKYAAVYPTRLTGGIGPDEQAFIETRDTFYIASVVDSGFPYVQHRGGPAGFLKVIDKDTLGFIDYPGNKQFITFGNLKTQTKVSLILMDYPRRARLKLIGEASMIEAAQDPALAEKLSIDGQAEAQRIVTINVTAIDWNCPKYITPRYTEGEIQQMLAPRMAEYDTAIRILSDRLRALGEDPAALLKSKEDQ